MKVPTQHAVRLIAVVLSYVFLFTQLAHAAKLPRFLAEAQTAQQPSTSQTPPTPSIPPSPEAAAQARLLAAHNIFIVNEGGDDHFPVSPAESQARFAATMQSWGRYRIVSSVADADLVLQLRSVVSTSVVDSTDNTGSTVYYNPYFRLVIADPPTLTPLWTITVPVLTGTRRKDKTDLFTLSAQNLTSQVKLLTGTPLTAREVADLRVPVIRRHHAEALIIGVTAAAVGLSLGLFFLARHNAKQNQQNFCTTHGIVPCPV
jgi:hypothetical protein